MTTTPDQADTDQLVEHFTWCRDPTVRSSEDFFHRGATRHRCLGCGATRTEGNPVTVHRRTTVIACVRCARPIPKGSTHYVTGQLAVWCDRCARRVGVDAKPYPDRAAARAAMGFRPASQ